jgi:hypothetical protein
MIEKDLEILKELVESKGNWIAKKSFDKVVNHCDFLDENFKDKSKYLERFSAWFIDQSIMTNINKWEYVNEFTVRKLLLDRLSMILHMPIKNTLKSIEYSIQYIDITNKRNARKDGQTSDIFGKIIRDFIAQETKDKYEQS